MKFQLSTPSKTYILGEYLSLLGGPALLLNSTPRFHLTVTNNLSTESSYSNFSENSVAVKYLKKHAEFFQNYSLKFEDPYQGLGGFGASSAQFGMLVAFKDYIENEKLNYLDIVKEYQSLITDGHYYLPSGADVVSQLCGGITYFNKNKRIIEKLVWPFPELSFALIHTGNKVYTDKYIADLRKFDHINFEKIVNQGMHAIQNADVIEFCDAVNFYSDEMCNQNLVNGNTLKILSEIKSNKFILAAKGCGALASDVILVYFNKRSRENFLGFANKFNLNVINVGGQAYEGLSIKDENSSKATQVILVDEQDQQIGIAEKQAAHQKAQLHRAYSIFIFRKNKENIEVLLQQRAREKYHTGGLWSNTCCSHPAPGEDILISAHNRLQQEMGISADLYEVGTFSYKADLNNGLVEHEYDHVFIGRYQNDKVSPDKNEIDDCQWIRIVDLEKNLLSNPQQYTPWLRQALELILQKNALRNFC